MSSEKKEKHIRHPLRKRILKVLISIFLVFLFLEFIVYFGSNLILSNWARRTINEATSEIYEIDFNRLNISLIRRGVFLDGIIMKPNENAESAEDQTLFDFSLDQLAIKGSWYSFSENNFYLGKLEFDNPNVKLDLGKQDSSNDESEEGEKKVSAVASLEQEIRKSILKSKLNSLIIREVEIKNADLFFLNFLSDNSLKVENSRLIVRDINWTTQEEWTTPFNARGFEFDLENGEFLLPDGVHKINAGDVFISSLENIIDIEDFEIQADKSKESKSYYQASLEKLTLNRVDLNRAFMTSDLLVEEIVLNEPNFNVGNRGSRETKEGVGTSDLYELINGVLNSIRVKELSINKGMFISADVLDTLRNRISIGELDFKMIQFYIGQDDSLRRNQFFYGQDASMEIMDADIYLSDQVHHIQGDKISVSSFKDEILIENFRINPRSSYSAELEPSTLIKIDLPQLVLNDGNLKKWYNEGKLDIDELVIDQPKVEIISNQVRTEKKDRSGSGINELLEGFIQEVKVKRFDINNGEVFFTNATGIRSNDIGFDKFSLLLEDVLVDPSGTVQSKELFFAEEMVLELDDYRLKLKDNLHEFKAKQILIDSKNELVQIKGFIIKPEDPNQIIANLKSYGKSGIIDLDIPLFRAEGIDIRQAFFDEELRIKLINIPSSNISLKQYNRKKKEGTASSSTSTSDIEELLTAYFRTIAIDSLSFRQGKLAYENNSGDKSISISEEDLDISLKNFRVDRGIMEKRNQTFFADEIDVEFKDYSFTLADGNYRVFSEDIRYNSREEKISIENLTLEPSNNLESKVALSITLPKVDLIGADIDALLFDNVLDLQKLQVVGSRINLEINPEIRIKNERNTQNRQRTAQLPRSIDLIQIDSIEAGQSNLVINYLLDQTDEQSIQTNFDLLVQGFNLDSISSKQDNISDLFEQIKISLQDFSFALPDSVHTMKFSDVELNTTTDESIFKNFQIIPNTYLSSPGKPVIEAQVDAVSIQNNKLAKIIQTGLFEVTQLSLTNPKVKVYLDQNPDEVSGSEPKELKERAKDGLVNAIVLDDLVLINGEVSLYNKEQTPIPKLDFEGINLNLADLNLKLLGGDKSISPDVFLEKDLSLSLTNYSLFTKDSLNKVSIAKINFLDRNVVLEGVKFGPTIGRYDYLRKQIYQGDAIEAFVSKITLEDINLETLLEDRAINAHALRIDQLNLDVFRDKRLPLKEGVIKLMPQELMQSAPFSMEVDSLIVSNSEITYQEFAPRAMLVGSITFEELNLSFAPFALYPDSIPYPYKKAFLEARTKIMGDGEVTLASEMLYAKPYQMNMEIKLGELDLRSISPMMERTAFIGVTSGVVKDGKWKFKVTEDEAWGKMNFNYEDLKIQFLDTLTLEEGKGKLGLMTFLANTVTKNKNPRGLFKKDVSSKIYYERDKSKFIFGGWWRATLSGLKGSVGLGKAKMPKRREDDEF